ncbi:phage tail tape measure protein, partial [Mycolicibacterium mageritense]|uniref:phage tail tape measure protein n=1 Tax=Mycolicibacterium mageritense TaxID=53462 RepID=UPI001E419965
MALDSVGYYALPVIPSFEGMDRQVNSQMRKSFGGFGKTLGLDVGKGIGEGLKSSANEVESAAKAHADALDKVKDATGKLRAEEAKLEAARSNAASRAQAVGTAERRLKEMRATGTATDQQLATAERSVASARERARNAAAQATSVEQRVEATRRREATATREAQRAEQDLANARRNAGAAGGRGGMFGGFRQSMQTEGGGLASLAGGIGGKIGGAFMGALGAVVSVAAVGSLFKSAIDTGIEFERTVNAFSGVTAQAGDTAEMTGLRMEKMRQAARALGTDTQLAGVSASDAGKAMLELAKGGMTAEQAMAAARGTLQLATAGQLDAAQAAAIQSAAINTFSLKATDAMHVADLLAASANASSADVADLGYALQQGGAVAAGFGVSIEDTLTALTMFSRMGINGADAGTMLKTSLQAITDQGNPAQGAIEELGLQLYDANKQFVGVESMMKQVAAASTRMSEEEFQAATAVLFGSDAMRASMVAAKGGAQAWDDAAAAVNRQGAAAEMAAAQMQGLPGVVESLSNVWEGFKLKLFDVIDGPLIAIGNWFTDVLSGDGPKWLQDYGDTFREVFGKVGETVGPVFEQIKAAFSGIGNFISDTLGPQFVENLRNMGGPLSDLGKQLVATFKEAAPVLKLVGMIIGGALLGSLKAIGFVYPMVIRGMTAMAKVSQTIYQAIKVGAGIIGGVAQVIGSVFVGAWNLAKGAIGAAWSVIQPVFDAAKAAFGFLADAARYAFDTVILPMWHNFQLIAGATAQALAPVWNLLKAGYEIVSTAAVAFWQGAVVPVWEGIKGAFTAGW